MSEGSTPVPDSAEPAKILLVDDEPNILSALQRELRQGPFALSTCTDPAEAKRAFQEQEFALVVSDNMMPGMTGLELLAALKESRPLTRRLLLTGHTDLTQAVAAFNEGIIHRFINKPWDRTQLLDAMLFEVGVYREQVRDKEDQQGLHAAVRTRTAQLLDALQALKQVQTQISLTEDLTDVRSQRLPERLQKVSILVVDGDEKVRDLTLRTLRRIGISRATGAVDADQALMMLRSGPPMDVILSEWKMAGMDGLGLFRAVRDGFTPSRRALFILCTAREAKVQINFALKQGVDGYLIKPFRLKSLFEQLERVLVHAQSNESATLTTLQSLRFLLVNSHTPSRDQIVHMLHSNKVTAVSTAWNGGLAIRLIQDQKPDVVIYDCNVKDPPWFGLQPTLEQAEIPVRPALVVTSVMPVKEELEQVALHKQAAFVPGPFRQDDLFQMIMLACGAVRA